MSVLRIILTILFIIVCIAITVLVLFQEGKSTGLGSLSGSTTADTFWSKNKSRSKESILIKATTILSVLFMLIALLLNLNII